MTMNYMLQHNLDVLSTFDPGLAGKVRNTGVFPTAKIAQARTGRPYLEIDGVSMCSRFDPDAEAETLAERILSKTMTGNITDVAVFGMGLGYHIMALARRFERVFVIESKLEIIRLALEHLDFRDVLNRTTFLFNPDQITPDSNTVMLVHAPSLRVSPQAMKQWRNLWPDWNQDRHGETFGELINTLNTLSGINRMGNHLDHTAPAELGPMVQQARRGNGPLTQAEQLVLLLDELGRD